MNLPRRQFLIVSAAVGAGYPFSPKHVATAIADETSPTSNSSTSSTIDAGPINDYPVDNVYDTFRDRGCFIIRRNDELFALSSICTHKGCKVRAEADHSFLCKCHGSTFDPDGRVTKGPAVRDLARLAVALNEEKHVMVDPGQLIQHVANTRPTEPT